MKKSKKAKKVLSLFDKNAVRKIRKERFNGSISVMWENGMIKDLKFEESFYEF